jgi:hypothetical protein
MLYMVALLESGLNEDKQKKDILEWLSPRREQGEQIKMHQIKREERTEGTGIWFLECKDFQRWAIGKGASVLYCHGEGIHILPVFNSLISPAGVGKSVITYLLPVIILTLISVQQQ